MEAMDLKAKAKPNYHEVWRTKHVKRWSMYTRIKERSNEIKSMYQVSQRVVTQQHNLATESQFSHECINHM